MKFGVCHESTTLQPLPELDALLLCTPDDEVSDLLQSGSAYHNAKAKVLCYAYFLIRSQLDSQMPIDVALVHFSTCL